MLPPLSAVLLDPGMGRKPRQPIDFHTYERLLPQLGARRGRPREGAQDDEGEDACGTVEQGAWMGMVRRGDGGDEGVGAYRRGGIWRHRTAGGVLLSIAPRRTEPRPTADEACIATNLFDRPPSRSRAEGRAPRRSRGTFR